MTPFEIGICLHYNNGQDTTPPEYWVPIGPKTFDLLVGHGLLRYGVGNQSRFIATPKLFAFVELLSRTPLPAQRFIDPRTESTLDQLP